MGVGKKAVADLHAGVKHRMGQQHGVVAHRAIITDHNIGPEVRSGPKCGTLGNHRRRVNAGCVDRLRVKQADRPRKRQLWVQHTQARTTEGRKGRLHDQRGGLAVTCQGSVLGIGHEADLGRSRGLDPRNAGHGEARGVLAHHVARLEIGPELLRQLTQGHAGIVADAVGLL